MAFIASSAGVRARSRSLPRSPPRPKARPVTPAQLHPHTSAAVAPLRGSGATDRKSAELSPVSTQPAPPRIAAVVLLGAGSSDVYAQQVGNELGALLGAATLNGVSSITPAGDHLVVERPLEDVVQVVEVPLPAGERNLDWARMHMLTVLPDYYGKLRVAVHNLEQGVEAEPALRNAAFFAVADRLLGLSDPVPAEANDLVNAELALINAANTEAISPIWDRPDLPADQKLIEVYGQYIPRGHYTRSEDLKMYFKAMMWYGRLTFRLRDDFETRRALLLVQALRNATVTDGTSDTGASLWESIYDPTVFIVGKADHLSYHEYGALSDSVFGAGAGELVKVGQIIWPSCPAIGDHPRG